MATRLLAAALPGEEAKIKSEQEQVDNISTVPYMSLAEKGFVKSLGEIKSNSTQELAGDAMVQGVANQIDEQQQEQDKAQRIVEGSKEVLPEQLGQGNVIDNNPNNRPATEPERDTFLSSVLGNPNASEVDLLTAIESDKNKEVEGQKEIRSLIDKYQKVPAGLDLSAFAALLDNPAQVKALSQTSGLTELDRNKLIDGLKLKLADRKDKFKASRRGLLVSMIKSREKEVIDGAKRKYQLNKDKAEKTEKAYLEFKNRTIKENTESMGKLGGVLEDLVANGISSKNAVVLRSMMARVVNKEVGALSTFDVNSVSAAPDLKNKLIAFIDKNFKGVPFTDTDISQIADIVQSVIKFDAKEIDRKAGERAKTFVKTWSSVFPVTLESLRNDKDGEFRTNQWVSGNTIKNAEDFYRRSREKIGKSLGAGPQTPEEESSKDITGIKTLGDALNLLRSK